MLFFIYMVCNRVLTPQQKYLPVWNFFISLSLKMFYPSTQKEFKLLYPPLTGDENNENNDSNAQTSSSKEISTNEKAQMKLEEIK